MCDLVTALWCMKLPPLEQLRLSGTAIVPFRISVVRRNTKKPRNRGKMSCCGGAEESKGGDGDAAPTVAHAVKADDGEEEEDVNAAAALPHAGARGSAKRLLLRRRAKRVLLRRRLGV
jgi:hypothetical protein